MLNAIELSDPSPWRCRFNSLYAHLHERKRSPLTRLHRACQFDAQYGRCTLARMASADMELVLNELAHYGLVLLSDQRLPSVVGLVAGAPVRGSWWGSPHGGRIYNVSVALDEHPDVTAVKLVSGKVTFVHRRLWSALVAVGTAREAWQLDGASASAQALLAEVAAQGEVRTDDVPWLARRGDAPRELERRLLVHADEVHTESGKHAKCLRTWQVWADRHRLSGVSVAAAKACFESIVTQMNTDAGARGRLPWQS